MSEKWLELVVRIFFVTLFLGFAFTEFRLNNILEAQGWLIILSLYNVQGAIEKK